MIIAGTVTKEHLTSGKPRVKGECPLAIAIAEAATIALGKEATVTVSYRRADIFTATNNYTVSLGYVLSEKVLRIDYGMPVEPFDFSLGV